MSAPPDPLPLAAEFPPATRDQWIELVTGVLRRSGPPEDADPVAALSSTDVRRDLGAAALHRRRRAARRRPGRPGSAPYLRGATARRADADRLGRPPAARRPRPGRGCGPACSTDLENGATSLWLAARRRRPAGRRPARRAGGRLPRPGPGRARRGRADGRGRGGVPAAGRRARRRPAEIRGNLGADPLGLRARTGAAGRPRRAAGPRAPSGTRGCGWRPWTRTAVPRRRRPATPRSSAVARRDRRRLPAGADRRRAARRRRRWAQLEFRYAATADQFANDRQAAGRPPALGPGRRGRAGGAGRGGQRQHAVTSPAMMTRRDPWVNMLRTTVACFAAGVGGADAVTVLPFDAALGLPDAFARRIARNTQSILLEESQLARVVDPAGGSWYVERSPTNWPRAAWALLHRDRAGRRRARPRWTSGWSPTGSRPPGSGAPTTSRTAGSRSPGSASSRLSRAAGAAHRRRRRRLGGGLLAAGCAEAVRGAAGRGRRALDAAGPARCSSPRWARWPRTRARPASPRTSSQAGGIAASRPVGPSTADAVAATVAAPMRLPVLRRRALRRRPRRPPRPARRRCRGTVLAGRPSASVRRRRRLRLRRLRRGRRARDDVPTCWEVPR